MRCRHLPCVMILLAASLASTRCLANDNGGRAFFNLLGPFIGGMLNAERMEAAKAAWAGLSSSDQFCFQTALGHQGYSISALIQNGVAPDDPRLAQISADCRQLSEATLRKN